MKKASAESIFNSLTAKAERLLEIARERGDAELEEIALGIAGAASALGVTAIGEKRKIQKAAASKPRKSKSVDMKLLDQAMAAYVELCQRNGEPVDTPAWRQHLADQLGVDSRTAKKRYAELGITEDQLLERLRSLDKIN